MGKVIAVMGFFFFGFNVLCNIHRLSIEILSYSQLYYISVLANGHFMMLGVGRSEKAMHMLLKNE